MRLEFLLLLVFVVAFGLTLLLLRYLLERSHKQRIVKYNNTGVRWASQRKSILGGVGFMCGFLISILSVHFAQYCLKVNVDNPMQVGVFVAIILAFVMGLVDDIFNTSPIFKFLMQFIVGVILITSGIYINLFDNQIANYGLTLLWVVGLMNSLNMLDNMDSVTNTMCVIILMGIIVFIICKALDTLFLVMIVGTLASMLAFYKYNWNPSSMYMGDNGSQFLGAFMAIMTIQYLWNPAAEQSNSLLYPFLIVYLACLVPLTDTTTVTINRLLRKKSPFVGGCDHTTHHLSYRGLSDRKVVLVLAIINALSTSTAIYLLLSEKHSTILVVTVAVISIIVSLMLYINTKITKPKAK